MNGKRIRMEIEKHLQILEEMDPRDPEYSVVVDELVIMTNLNRETFLGKIDINEIFKLMASVGGIALVLNFERFDVVRSKGFGLIRRIF